MGARSQAGSAIGGVPFLKVLAHIRYNLSIRHLVHGFNGHDAATGFVFLDPFLEFALGLARTKDKNRLGIACKRNDFVVITVKMARELALARIIG